jgi:hypothetical protein
LSTGGIREEEEGISDTMDVGSDTMSSLERVERKERIAEERNLD